jgi:hypothetical protein
MMLEGVIEFIEGNLDGSREVADSIYLYTQAACAYHCTDVHNVWSFSAHHAQSGRQQSI